MRVNKAFSMLRLESSALMASISAEFGQAKFKRASSSLLKSRNMFLGGELTLPNSKHVLLVGDRAIKLGVFVSVIHITMKKLDEKTLSKLLNLIVGRPIALEIKTRYCDASYPAGYIFRRDAGELLKIVTHDAFLPFDHTLEIIEQ